MDGMRKITYWEKYAVKRFPYRGQRRYTPCIYQSFDGGIIISNDVFGLTIRQFERTFTDCLNKRKKHEQWILNLRYPDKSSNEYIEYLQNCTDFNKDHYPWTGIDFKGKYLYEHLVNIVGSEIDIRTRQRLFIIHDKIQSHITSGSLAEGIDLPGSDEDIMCVVDTVDVVRNVQNITYPIERTTLFMDTDNDHPGFARLRLISEGQNVKYDFKTICESTKTGVFVSVQSFVNDMKKKYSPMSTSIELYSHGPCLSDKEQTIDIAFCFKSKCFPYPAIPWSFRHRNQWPSTNVMDKIINYGCLLVAIGPRIISNNQFLWRISFSMAEKQLVHSFNFTQLLCYGLLKLTLKHIINKNDDVKDLLCSYFLKTALFWVSEEVDIDTFQMPKLFNCFSLCLNKLILWVDSCYCPNYFIPEQNMYRGKITPDNNQILLHVLDGILLGGIEGLINNIFSTQSLNHLSISKNSDISFIVKDFLFYRTCGTSLGTDILDCYSALELTDSLRKSESSAFLSDSCIYRSALISKSIAQQLPKTMTINEKYNIHKRIHKHLQNGIKADAVSGWLLYASFYYVTGQYEVALKLTDYVLLRSTPDMVYIGLFKYDEEDIHHYRQNVHHSVSLNAKMKISTVNGVTYLKHSPLIPEELQLQVENSSKGIPPVVMTHCLRFLCYNRLRDISNRQHALRDLHLTVENCYFIGAADQSISLTILGICYDLSGDKDNAYKCYDEALQCT